MKHKFCPSCGSLDMKRLVTGMEECIRCKYRGEFKEGSMDEINTFRKSHKPSLSPSSSSTVVQHGASQQAPKNHSALKDRLNSLKGRKTDDFEII